MGALLLVMVDDREKNTLQCLHWEWGLGGGCLKYVLMCLLYNMCPGEGEPGEEPEPGEVLISQIYKSRYFIYLF